MPLREALINSIVHNDFCVKFRFMKVVFLFFLSANDGNAAIGDNNGDISGDNQSYSNKVLLLLEKDLILQQKE